MKKAFCALAAAAMIIVLAMAAPNDARADGGRITAGVVGGLLGGAILGSVLAPRPHYYAPAPVYVPPEPAYVEPLCIARQQVYDPYYNVYRWQRVQVPCY